MAKNKTKRFLISLIILIVLAVVIKLFILNDSLDQEANIESKDNSSIIEENIEKTDQDTKEEPQDTAKYYTVSSGGNVDVGVIFKNPLTGETKDLVFEVMLNTHSVDLGKYKELQKYVELQVDEKIIITEGFTWESEGEGHHMSGLLRLKNEYNGEPILTNNTTQIKLILKNVEIESREHIYKEDTLR